MTVGIRIRLEPGWHTYWINPGDAGAPLSVTWHLPDGVTAGALQWPAPVRLEEDGLVSFVYERELLCLATATTSRTLPVGTHLELKADVAWMVCRDVCVPHDAVLSASVRVESRSEPAPADMVSALTAARDAMPGVDAGWAFQAAATTGAVQLVVTPPVGTDAAVLTRADFFPEARGVIDYAQRGRWTTTGGRATLDMVRSGGDLPAGGLAGVLVWASGEEGAPKALVVIADRVP